MQRWAVGVTTVPERRDDLLPRTLESLKAAGFPLARLFVDGAKDGKQYDHFPYEGLSFRWPRIRAYGSWILGLYELLIRNPDSSRFLMAQDDVVFCRNTRDYLDGLRYPDGGSDKRPGARGYWNLFSVPKEEVLAKVEGKRGWHPSRQQGKGALALAFDRDTVVELLTHQHMVERPFDANRGWRNIDGGVLECLKKCHRKELVHFPSLCQHMGDQTTIPKLRPEVSISETFPGEDKDAMGLGN